ncbi:MAG: right-handed parallel beta-helix repeat-containing protein [Desulfobacteraceae bacterium]|nr:right-handed parallel beta-helix repeat-containing protein [Desulfobacteraceae bacterium]
MSKRTILLLALAVCLLLTSVALAGKPPPDPPAKATNPSPADSATGVDINADLSWDGDSEADSFDVYFGTTSPGDPKGNQPEETYEPGTMDESTPYYWRIDSINEGGTTEGDVWSFTTGYASGGPDYYVATDGNDANPGTLNEPFATLEHALLDVVEPGDTIYMRGGSYHEEISAAAGAVAGTPGNPITITNYQDEVVTLDGSEALSDLDGATWTKYSGNIYTTSISKDIWQLWVDGRMMIPARWPNISDHYCDPLQLKADGITPVDGSWADRSASGSWGWMANPWNAQGDLTNDDSIHDMGAEGVSFAGGSIILNFKSESQFARPIESHSSGSNELTYTPVQNPHDQGQSHFMVEAMSALDEPGEWYYDDGTGEVRLWCENGQTPQGRDVRGKTISYALDINDVDYVTIKGIDFFGCTIRIPNGFHITIEDCNFSYPSWYRRMVGIYGYQGEPEKAATQPPEIGATFLQSTVDTDSYYTIRNCKFEYSDGVVSMFPGVGNLVENCLFHHFSFTGMAQMLLMANVNHESLIKRCTFHTNGSKVMVKHSHASVDLCHFTKFGYLQYDGCSMQCAGGQGAGGGSDGTVRSYIWHHNAWKTGGRWDGSNGINGTDHHYVAWNVPSVTKTKGDYHKVLCNTNTDPHDPYDAALKIVDTDPLDPKNRNTEVHNNLSSCISSDSQTYVPLTCIHSNNWNGAVDSTGWGDMAKHRVRDSENWDFRPKAGSDVIDAGVVYSPYTDGYLGEAPDIGAYEDGDTNYWIPGYQYDKACTPVPPDDSDTVRPDADLMWLAGLDADSHKVYFGTDQTPDAGEYQGEQTTNIYDPGALNPSTTYYWRIDTIVDSETITGDVWSFTPKTPVQTEFVDFGPTEDTHVESDNPTNNYGTSDVLSLATHTDGTEREGYMKFDVDVPGDVASAGLHLYATGASTSGGVQVWTMTNTSWDEMTMTYEDAPDIDGDMLQEKDIYSLSYALFDVTDGVSGNGIISFGLDRHLSTSFRGISSRENANSPFLTVEYVNGPTTPPANPTGLTATAKQ